MKSRKPGKVFDMGIRREIIHTINQLNGMFNQYLHQLQTASVKESVSRSKNR